MNLFGKKKKNGLLVSTRPNPSTPPVAAPPLSRAWSASAVTFVVTPHRSIYCIITKEERRKRRIKKRRQNKKEEEKTE